MEAKAKWLIDSAGGLVLWVGKKQMYRFSGLACFAENCPSISRLKT